MADSLQGAQAVRLSRGTFDPSRYEEVVAMNKHTSEYLIPALQALPGLIHYYIATSPLGHVIGLSLWENFEQAAALDGLKDMFVRARGEAREVGVTFHDPIITHATDWIA